jgi:hypothetical protein
MYSWPSEGERYDRRTLRDPDAAEHGEVTRPLIVCGNKARSIRVSFGDQGVQADAMGAPVGTGRPKDQQLTETHGWEIIIGLNCTT